MVSSNGIADSYIIKISVSTEIVTKDRENLKLNLQLGVAKHCQLHTAFPTKFVKTCQKVLMVILGVQ